MIQNKNIVLIGFMGCGKTSVGMKLSYRLRMPVMDTDKLIEQREHRSIKEIFRESGEHYFREVETRLLGELKDKSYRSIYSVGGGTPVKEGNGALLKKLGTVVYLRIRPENVYQRLKNDTTRPLLQCEDPLERIRSLMNERKNAYEGCADFVIDVDHLSVDNIVDEIERKLSAKGRK